jgi:hypothetical protein
MQVNNKQRQWKKRKTKLHDIFEMARKFNPYGRRILLQTWLCQKSIIGKVLADWLKEQRSRLWTYQEYFDHIRRRGKNFREDEVLMDNFKKSIHRY